MKLFSKVTLLLSITFFLTSCSNSDKEDDPIIEKEPLTVPKLTTEVLSDITYNSAKSGGNITDDGGSNVIARGICWGKNNKPTLNDNVSNDGTGTGTFVSTITELEENTQYYLRAYATNSEGTAYGNEVVFSTVEEPEIVFEGDVVLSTQREVDDFVDMGYTEITGSLTIGTDFSDSSNNIKDVSGLASIESIGENITIRFNHSLVNFNGLNKIEKIDGWLDVTGNNVLEGFDGLKNLESIGGAMQFNGNQSLTNIKGLTKLSSIKRRLSITVNPVLTNIEGLSELTSIDGFIEIAGTNLVNLDIFNKLISIGGNLNFFRNDNLISMNGFQNLTSVGGDFNISTNNSLIEIQGFQKLKTVGGEFSIGNNEVLEQITGFPELLEVNGPFTINNFALRTPKLTEISGFNKLTSVGGFFNIRSCFILIDFTGFNNLESVGGNLRIADNNRIDNLDNLANLNTVEGGIFIHDNDLLSNFCGFETVINNNLSQEFSTFDNLYNPSRQDIIDGNCSK